MAFCGSRAAFCSIAPGVVRSAGRDSPRSRKRWRLTHHKPSHLAGQRGRVCSDRLDRGARAARTLIGNYFASTRTCPCDSGGQHCEDHEKPAQAPNRARWAAFAFSQYWCCSVYSMRLTIIVSAGSYAAVAHASAQDFMTRAEDRCSGHERAAGSSRVIRRLWFRVPELGSFFTRSTGTGLSFHEKRESDCALFLLSQLWRVQCGQPAARLRF